MQATGRNKRVKQLGVVVYAFVSMFAVQPLMAQDKKTKLGYGSKLDVVFAKRLWRSLQNSSLIGRNRIQVHAFEGSQPHGFIQQSLATRIRVGNRRGRVIVKANHKAKQDGQEVDTKMVYDQPNTYLDSYTVMFRRRPGYDPENRNWFWVKYSPNGEISKGPTGVPVAGRVGKYTDFGCIGCHRAVGGEDLEALTSK